MKLRKLRIQDAPLMLEWMHDDMVVHYFRKDFSGRTEEDCIRFIRKARDETENIHLAVADDSDEYMGTVSLKHIKNRTAEFGIAMRACAMGKGYALYGMKEIMEYGYRNRKIDHIYWCVEPDNLKAVHFYEKLDFPRCEAPDQAAGYTEEEKRRYIWYHVQRDDSKHGGDDNHHIKL